MADFPLYLPALRINLTYKGYDMMGLTGVPIMAVESGAVEASV